MVCAIAVPCLTLDAMANESHIQAWIRSANWAQSISTKQIPFYCYNEHFIDPEDRLINGELPTADFSRGGVYVIGASNLTWGLRLWDLPAKTRSLINNFATKGSNPVNHLQMIRYLVEEKGLLRAGGSKTLVVFGVAHHMTHNIPMPGNPGNGWNGLWTRRGFYQVEPDGSIHRTARNPLWERIIIERAKITGLVHELVNIAYTPFKPARVLKPSFFKREWTSVLGPRWQEKMEAGSTVFGETIDYLQQHGARILVVEMPEGSWEDDLPFRQTYKRLLSQVCEERRVEIVDLSKLVPDDDFADSVHLTTAGIEKFQAAVMGRFLDHLRSVGAIAPDPSSAKSASARSIIPEGASAK
jgi:hypothetical protein